MLTLISSLIGTGGRTAGWLFGRRAVGLVQGSGLSPLLCNYYLDAVDRPLLNLAARRVSSQGQRVGEMLLTDALERAAALSKSLGVFAVEVLAIGEHAAAFYAKYGFMPLLDDPQHLFLPISAIEAALPGRSLDAPD